MYLGLDIGTSAIKALLLDSDMGFIATQSAPLSVSRPQDGVCGARGGGIRAW